MSLYYLLKVVGFQNTDIGIVQFSAATIVASEPSQTSDQLFVGNNASILYAVIVSEFAYGATHLTVIPPVLGSISVSGGKG